jgi:DNA-binding beta-propeller fold protein YncE
MNMFMPKENITVGELQKCELSSDLLTRVSEVTESYSYGSSRMNGAMSPRTPRAQSPRPYNGSRAMSPRTTFIDNIYGVPWHNPKLRWKIDKTGSKKGEINEAYDVAIFPNGDIVVAEWLNQRLQIFDTTGYSKEIVGANMVQPWGVTVTRDGNLAVTDEKDRTLKIFSPQGYLVVAWKKMMFGWPRGIVVNRAGQFIVTDNQHGKHSVSIHLPDGKCIRQIGSQGSGNEQFHWPRYVTVDHHDRIIVADSSNHCIKVFDPMGQFIFKFGSLGNNDGQMKHPRGVCVDPNDNILVADQDNDRISMYGPDGKFLRHVLNIQRPWGVALSNDGTMAVTQKPALCIFKVFDG